MSSPFASRDHCAVAPGLCKCGRDFADGLALDVHIMGPELAMVFHRDRAAALKAIHEYAESVEPKPVSCTYGCHGGNNNFDCPVHGGMRGGEAA